ncbi:MAG TPA: pyruvate carboxylase subunit B [Usitatibacter sp.]|jgi:oxaloacetate decarboxylase alpha subunit|nr:pyruvate carboxylase subunit B [Usitatibacter sp.]
MTKSKQAVPRDAKAPKAAQPRNREIRVIDTTLRDAHQCLWATRMRTAHMLPVLDKFDRVGYESIDLMGTIQFDVCVRYLKEDPWERVRRVHQGAPHSRFRSLIRSKNIVAFDFLPDDIIELWVDRLYGNGFRVIGAFDGLNDVDNIAGSLKRAKRLGAYTFGALSYSESPVHNDELFARTAKALIDRADVDAIMIKDAGGLLTVDRIRTLVPALRKVIGERPLELHSHCLTGLAPLVYLEGARLGCDQLHLSIKPLANGAAQPAVQTVVKNLRDEGFRIDVDDALIDEISRHFADIAEREGKPVGVPIEYDAFHYQHQLPGGMLSNFRAQLAVAGLSHKFDELMEECARVRQDLAWPIMITPFSQFVGTQAVLNVVHGERYRFVPNEVKKYALGYYGKLLAPVDPEALDRIVENGSKDIALEPQPIPPGVDRLRKQYPNATDDERLLRYQLPGNAVDEMVAAQPMDTLYDPTMPLAEFVKKIIDRRKPGRVYIRKGDFELGMTSR